MYLSFCDGIETGFSNIYRFQNNFYQKKYEIKPKQAHFHKKQEITQNALSPVPFYNIYASTSFISYQPGSFPARNLAA